MFYTFLGAHVVQVVSLHCNIGAYCWKLCWQVNTFCCILNHLLDFRLQRLAIILLTLHYMVEMSFHLSRILHYHQKEYIASLGFVCDVVIAVQVVLLLIQVYHVARTVCYL